MRHRSPSFIFPVGLTATVTLRGSADRLRQPIIRVLDDSRQGYWEGCLSVPGLRGFVVRPQRIAIDYYDREGKPQHTEVTGFTATVFQHEFDHLQAKLYVDHIEDSRLLVFEDQFLAHDVDEHTRSLRRGHAQDSLTPPKSDIRSIAGAELNASIDALPLEARSTLGRGGAWFL